MTFVVTFSTYPHRLSLLLLTPFSSSPPPPPPPSPPPSSPPPSSSPPLPPPPPPPPPPQPVSLSPPLQPSRPPLLPLFSSCHRRRKFCFVFAADPPTTGVARRDAVRTPSSSSVAVVGHLRRAHRSAEDGAGGAWTRVDLPHHSRPSPAPSPTLPAPSPTRPPPHIPETADRGAAPPGQGPSARQARVASY